MKSLQENVLFRWRYGEQYTLLNVLFWLMALAIITVRYDKKLSDPWKPMNTKEYIAYSVFINVFEIQYALNFFVYIFRSPQYRSAFIDIYKNLNNTCCSRLKSLVERRRGS